MLKELYIKNVVLIKDISISFKEGLSVFTGETGAGKSILLDSLAMALGERADFSMVGKHQDFAEIIAVFKVNRHPVEVFLKENFITLEDNLIIKRIITKDGKSKAFINDVPVSVSFLRNVGSLLLDIHGQFDNQKLLNPGKHKEILDSFLKDKSLLNEVANAYKEFKDINNLIIKKKEGFEALKQEKEYMEYSLLELTELNPKKNEEKNLLEKKQVITSLNRIKDVIDVLEKHLIDSHITSSINKSLKQIEGLKKILPNNQSVENMEECLEKSYQALEEAIGEFRNIKFSFDSEDDDVKLVETRLMEIRSLARKHRVIADDLVDLISTFKEKINSLIFSEDELKALEQNLIKKVAFFNEKAELLSKQRIAAAKDLEDKINQELAYLKLPMASFKVQIDKIDPTTDGIDKIVFKVRTNKGGEFGDLNKVASGGEVARFMLALKSVLAEVDVITTMILDEVDVGVGGEVAIAVGNRLLHISKNIQLIVVTHSHQVASKGDNHYKVTKDQNENNIETKLLFLNTDQRIIEIARMISGDNITNTTIATAKDFLANR